MGNVYPKSRVYVSIYCTLIDWLNYKVWDLVIESCMYTGRNGYGHVHFPPS